MTGEISIACPCGGHAVALAPDKPPVGGRAAFTCPACGQRRTFVRTPDGAAFDAPPTSPVSDPTAPPLSAASGPRPGPVRAGAAVVLAALAGLPREWTEAVEHIFPGPAWQVLPADAPDQAAADLRAHAPAVVVAAAGPESQTLLAAVAALSGRAREKLALVVVGDGPEGDAMAAFAASADAVLDKDNIRDIPDRLRAALETRVGRPSLFEAD